MSNINFSQFLTKKFSALNTNNALSSGNLRFGSLTEMNRYASLFDMSSVNLLNGVDYSAIIAALQNGSLEGLEGENQNAAAMINELLSIDGVQEQADLDGDGEISAEEMQQLIESIATADGDMSNLSVEDVDALMEKMGINLEEAVEDAVAEALVEAAETPEITPASTPASAPAVTSGGARTSDFYSPRVNTTTTAETPEQIKEQITAKETEISEIETEAEQQIAEQEDAKEQYLKDAGLSEEQIENYKEKEQAIENNINGKEQNLRSKEDEIVGLESDFSSNENYISQLESQINTNKSKMGGLDSAKDTTESKKAEIQKQIENLERQRDAKIQENEKLQEKIDRAKEEKEQIEQDIAQLEKDKTTLNTNTMMAVYKGSAEGVAKALELEKFDTNIANIRNEKNEKISEIKNDIKELQVKLKDTEAVDERNSFLNENKAKTGFGISGEEFAQYAIDVANQMNSTGWCATGVHHAVLNAFGISMNGNGCDWDTNMNKLCDMGYFEDVTGQYTSPDQLVNLPAGAVVVWENNASHQYGHVSIATGDGHECSDHYQNQITKYGTPYHVYYIVD